MGSKSLSLPSLCFALLVSASSPDLFAQQVLIGQSSMDSRLGHVPMVFEPNRGQAEDDVSFVSRGNGFTVLIGSNKTSLVVSPSVDAADQRKHQPSVLTLELVRSNKESIPSGLDQLPGKSNYFIGKQSANWITGIPQYGRVAFNSVYDGIDLVYYGNDGQLECDFVLSPGRIRGR